MMGAGSLSNKTFLLETVAFCQWTGGELRKVGIRKPRISVCAALWLLGMGGSNTVRLIFTKDLETLQTLRRQPVNASCHAQVAS